MFPTPFVVTHSTAVVVGENALGQQVTEMTSRERAVMGWSTKSANDGGSAVLAGRVTTSVTLLTDEPDWADGDRVSLPGAGEFVVHGDPLNSNTGPFGFTPGYRVMLRRVNHESA